MDKKACFRFCFLINILQLLFRMLPIQIAMTIYRKYLARFLDEVTSTFPLYPKLPTFYLGFMPRAARAISLPQQIPQESPS